MEVITFSGIRPIAHSVLTDSFSQLPASDLLLLQQEQVRLGTPLDLSFQAIVQQILSRVSEYGSTETVGVMFDDGTKSTNEKFVNFCGHYMATFFLGEHFAAFCFGDSKKHTPLQAADLLAYGTNHLVKASFAPSIEYGSDFPVLPAFNEMLEKLAESSATSPNGKLSDLESLKALVVKVSGGYKFTAASLFRVEI